MCRLRLSGLAHICSPTQQVQALLLLIFRHTGLQEDGEVLKRFLFAERVWFFMIREGCDHLLLDVHDATSGDTNVAVALLRRPTSEHVPVRLRDSNR